MNGEREAKIINMDAEMFGTEVLDWVRVLTQLAQ